MAKERLVWADALKGILIILIISGHSCNGVQDSLIFHYNSFLGAFTMPSFMAVSGFFAYKRGGQFSASRLIRRRVFQLLVPFFIWSLIKFLFEGNYSVQKALDIILTPDAYAWFLWALFWISLIYIIGEFFSIRFKIDNILVLITTCLVLLFVMVVFNFRLFGFQFIAYFYLYYSLGILIRRFEVLQVRNMWVLFCLLIPFMILSWYWRMHELPYWMPSIPYLPTTLVLYMYRGITGVLGVILSIGFSIRFLNNSSACKLLSDIGQFSLGLYVTHIAILKPVFDFVDLLIIQNIYLLVIIRFAILFTISYTVVALLKKNRITMRYLLGKV